MDCIFAIDCGPCTHRRPMAFSHIKWHSSWRSAQCHWVADPCWRMMAAYSLRGGVKVVADLMEGGGGTIGGGVDFEQWRLGINVHLQAHRRTLTYPCPVNF
ncbi:unnamed protein product [Cuscuta europaea]|uniref:Uncharacterized protein n=2 Tax=Cuscuta europaea TaxID=41803 RepID=A0A9P1DZF4_CUSEU|nr:unnamed protein product [Cuscuta europaea]